MAQATRKKASHLELSIHLRRGLREVALWVFGALALYLVVALLSYNPDDPSWSVSTSHAATNAGGLVGAWLSDLALKGLGYLGYLLPLIVAYGGWMLFRDPPSQEPFDPAHFTLRAMGFVLAVGGGAGLAQLQLQAPTGYAAGGYLGEMVSGWLVKLVNFPGANLFLLALFLSGITLFTGLSWLGLIDTLGRLVLAGAARAAGWLAPLRHAVVLQASRLVPHTAPAVEDLPVAPARSVPSRSASSARVEPRLEPILTEPAPREPRVPRPSPTQVPVVPLASPPAGGLPTLSLLDSSPPVRPAFSPETLEHLSRQVEARLAEFGVEVQVVAAHPGPVITRFEVQPAPGVKVSQISNLAKDLARSLSVISVRVVEVIPGRSTVGLEIPNEQRETVRLGEVLHAQEYRETSALLPLGLGKDIGGRPVVVDLQRMPHLLVAGTTGSGKSVAINAMILSLLYKATPADVRLIMIDPKMLELSVYQGIPHLLAPVVTDMKEAANALRWCVAEMERRYQLMAALGVRNIAGFNRKVALAAERAEPLIDPLYAGPLPEEAPTLGPLPFIVVLVDELADMMMVVGKKVEELIARLAQKARAAGIHLIVATQRPSVDVITGLIKANIPTRISFQVSSKVDSRTILDQMGAEHLLGYGDMLYLAPGTGVPVRVHGAFVSDQEVHAVVEDLKRLGGPDYLEDVLSGPSEGEALGGSAANGGEDAEDDPLYDQALRIVTETRRASVSGVQRRLKIGYNRAARLVEAMERAGAVGPLQPNGSREVFAPAPPED